MIVVVVLTTITVAMMIKNNNGSCSCDPLVAGLRLFIIFFSTSLLKRVIL